MRSAASTSLTLWAAVILLVTSIGGASQGQAQDYQTSRYKDWTVRCQQRESLPSCDLYQTVINQERQQQVMMVSLAYSEELDKYAFQAVVPLGFLIQPGVLIRVDGERDFEDFKVTRCKDVGCFVEGIPSAEFLAAFSTGNSAQLIMLNEEREPVGLPISLMGFKAALEEMLSKS